MTNGARHFGDKGRRLGEAEAVLVAVDAGGLLPSNNSNSGVSSSVGPDTHEVILSPNICCFQAMPGTLIDRS